MEMKKYKRDVLLIVIIISISCILFLANRILFSKPARQVEISVDGEVMYTLNLNQDSDILVTGYNGGTNRIVIKAGRVHVSEATCPDKICVHQGWIEQTGESIVCLPNRMIARITGD